MRYLFFLLFLVYGCTNIGEPTSTSFTTSSYNTNSTELIFLSESKFNTEMIKGLSTRGYIVKPFVSQQQVTQVVDEKTKIKYNEASARYGIKIEGTHTTAYCILNNSGVYKFTIMLIDIATNEIINIYEQRASFPDKCKGAKQDSIIANYVNHLNNLNL